MAATPDQHAKLYANFLSSRKILVADSYAATRNMLAKIIVALGAKHTNLFLIDNYAEAIKTVEAFQPEILIVDYGIGKNSGLDLSEQTKTYTNKEDKIFILVTGNSSQSAVAQAAEEDVDVFILKPFTIKGFTDILKRTILAKIYPSDYVKAIQAGKRLLETNDLDGALAEFARATTLTPKPSLAFYYQAQAELAKNLFENAEASYSAGLQANNLHYRCLTGYFDLLVRQKRNVDAYRVVKQLARFFPANPNRLGQVLSLAINTGNYADIEQYYETFKEMEERNVDLVRYVCASLVVCGKHYFKIGDSSQALAFLKKATVSAAGKPLILREIVTVLIDNKKEGEAEEVLKRFSESHRNDPHFLVSEFLLRNSSEPEKMKLIPNLRKLVREQIKEPIIWYWLIFHLVNFNKLSEAETVCEDAVHLWPAKESLFKSALKAEEIVKTEP